MDDMKAKQFQGISPLAVQTILGLKQSVPLDANQMSSELQVTFYPQSEESIQLERFTKNLKCAFEALGIEILDYDDALLEEASQKIKPGTVIFAPGAYEPEELAINRVSSLYNNPIVGIYDAPCPVNSMQTTQEKLDAVVGVLAWNMVHMAIFVDHNTWTICTMNGGIVTYRCADDLFSAIQTSLIPKLTAQVIPPNKSHNIVFRLGGFDLTELRYKGYLGDFMSCGKIWAQNQCMLSHTSVESLGYRSAYYKRIVKAYLDHRSGMSYGFLAWQLPIEIKPALSLTEAQQKFPGIRWCIGEVVSIDDQIYVCLAVEDEPYVMEVPDVWVLSTRSGCNKTGLDPEKDILRLGLVKGQIILETPATVDLTRDCKPSYDTLTILAHAVGNALVGGICKTLKINSRFSDTLEKEGLSLTHWHNYLEKSTLPEGHFLHGFNNPSVACSTPQSAIYALLGKFEAFHMALSAQQEFLGDVHVEPDHGTNISSAMSLTQTAQWIDAHEQTTKVIAEAIER